MRRVTSRDAGAARTNGCASIASIAGSSALAVRQPIAAMHCQVSFLHGAPSEDGVVAMSLQSMPAIVACFAAGLAITGAIAIAVD